MGTNDNVGIEMHRVSLWLMVGGSGVLACSPHVGPGRPQSTAVGCYRFDRPLGPSAAGDMERADSAWYSVHLQADGGIGRPQLVRASERKPWESRSAWRRQGDTVIARIFTGLVGWEVTLTPVGGDYAGEAHYLTDARAVGWEPPRYPVRAKREACTIAAPPT